MPRIKRTNTNNLQRNRYQFGIIYFVTKAGCQKTVKLNLNIMRENYLKAKILFPAKLTFKLGGGGEIKTFFRHGKT